MASPRPVPREGMRVCIYGEMVAEALEGNVIGGAELQAALLARALARAGMTVTVVDPRARTAQTTGDGVAVRNIPGWNLGPRGLRFFTRRIPGLIRVCRSLAPTVYYMRGFSFLYLALLTLARRSGARSVLAIA